MSLYRRWRITNRCFVLVAIGLFAILTKVATANSKVDLPSRTDQDRIYSLIRLARPRLAPQTARGIARIMYSEARREKIPPLAVAATAYIESEMKQSSGPSIGIMQVNAPSLREFRRKHPTKFSGLDPHDYRDNIRIGVRELGLHKRTHKTLQRMWGRYNGCGPSGSYVGRVTRVYSKLKNQSPRQWRQHLARKPLWR